MTCNEGFIKFYQQKLNEQYPEVTINDPYVGGHITQHVGQYYPTGDNIQIEISRAIYMDEQTKEMKRPLTKKLKPILTECLIDGFEKFFSPKG